MQNNSFFTLCKEQESTVRAVLLPRHGIRGSYPNSLRLIIRCSADTVQLLTAALLCPFTLITDVHIHFLSLLFCDSNTFSMIPVSTKITANIEPKSVHNENDNVIVISNGMALFPAFLSDALDAGLLSVSASLLPIPYKLTTHAAARLAVRSLGSILI